MNFDPHQASAFFDPLSSKSSIFLVADRETNLSLARTLLGRLLSLNMNCLVVDINAFYVSHAEELGIDGTSNITFYVPDVLCDTSEVVHTIITIGNNDVLIIDNINSLFHLLSYETPQAASRKLALIMAILSKHARTNHFAAISVMYERKFASSAMQKQPLSELGDVLISVRKRGTGLAFHVRKGDAWIGSIYDV